MYRGTTPSIDIVFDNVNLEEAKVYITLYEQKSKTQIDLESGTDFVVSPGLNNSSTMISLTQEQTLALGTGLVCIQARWVFQDGVAGATQVAEVQMQDVLKKGVIEYGE